MVTKVLDLTCILGTIIAKEVTPIGMVTPIGSVGEFELAQEDWAQYAERLGHFMAANRIARDERRRTVLLTTIGAKAYKLLRNLVYPQDKSYVELVDAMKHHYNPKPSVIVQCYKFNCRFQKEG